MTSLFDPLTLRGLTARNRIWVAPMCQYSCFAQDGIPTDWQLVHLGGFAKGGAGLILTEATAVAPEGRISPEDAGIWNDEQRDAWRPIVDFARSQGALIGMQLAHAGRKGSTASPLTGQYGSIAAADGGWETVAPSPIAFGDFAPPRALETRELAGIVAAFAAGARRAIDAGFDLVEVHAAHGYLLHQFLSPLSNHREDDYGGSLENRARLLVEIVRAVRAAIGDAPLLIRFSATDWAEGGWDVEETTTVSAWVHEAGADLIDVSTGGLVPDVQIPLGPSYQLPFAEAVRAGAGVPASAVGLITEVQQAAAIVAGGRADAVMLGREFLRDPQFPLRAARELGVDLDYWPPQYRRARR